MWRWEGGDKEQSSVVSATDNERSVWLAVILLVRIRRPCLIPGFLASLLLLCFSLLSTFFAFIGQPGPSCKMGFSSADRVLCTDGLLTNWLNSVDMDLVSA